MARKAFAVALLCALAAIAAFAPVPAKPAAACSPVANPSIELTTRHADLVVVGEAISSSTVRVVAALKGASTHEVSISRFNDSDCPDPPGVSTGQRVLLFLGRYRGSFQIFGFGQGKYILTTRGEAEPEPIEHHVSSSRPAVRQHDRDRDPARHDCRVRRKDPVSGDAGPSRRRRRHRLWRRDAAARLDAALAFARGETEPGPQSDIESIPADAGEGGAPSALLIGLISAGAVVGILVLAGVARYAVRRRIRS